MARSGKSKKSKAATVNFKGTESGGRSISDGWATGKIIEAELTTAKESGNEMFKIVIAAKRGKEKAKVYDNLVLTPNALWKMRSLLEAAGIDVDEEDDMTFTADDLLDLEFDMELVNENFEGKDRPKPLTFAPLGSRTGEEDDEEEDEEEDDEDEKPAKKKASKKKAKDDDDEEDDDDSDDDDSDDDDDDSSNDDDEDDDEEEEDEPPVKGKGKAKRKSKSDDDDDEEEEEDDEDDDGDDEDEEDEDEDDDDEPKKKKGKKSKSKFKAGQKVKFEDDKGRVKSGVITAIDGDTVFVEDSKDVEWELSADEIL
jgi:hypothetical protein